MRPITPCLWFVDDLEHAIAHYSSIFPGTEVHVLNHHPDGKLFTAEWTMNAQRFMGLNGGVHHQFNDSVSMMVPCDSQAEVDRLWDAFIDGGGKAVQCGWLLDRFGLSWQIVPVEFLEIMTNASAAQAEAVMTTMMPMQKLDMAALRAAYDSV
ncbi:MAG: VOC family protein [Acidimicrobiia bacterium]